MKIVEFHESIALYFFLPIACATNLLERALASFPVFAVHDIFHGAELGFKLGRVDRYPARPQP